VIHLADFPCTVAFVPTLLEAEHLDVEASCAIDVGNE
jgi:hypothetical protein